MTYQLIIGDCVDAMKNMAENSVNCCVTSPPYFGLRDYGVDGQIGLERTPEEYVSKMVDVFREVRRVLREDGTLWINIGDSYANGGRKTRDSDNKLKQRKMTIRPDDGDGVKPKDLIGIPWMLAFALRADGWYLRQEIIWHKPNQMPESVKDRCTKAHEQIFMLSKSPRYHFDSQAIKEPSASATSLRQRRSVWSVATCPYKGAHFATFPPALIEPCILAGCPDGGVVLDPFGGAGTTAGVAMSNGRKAILCELNPEYGALVAERVDAILRSKETA